MFEDFLKSVFSTIRSAGDADKSINYIQLHDLTTKLITDFEDLQKTLMNQTIEMNNRDIILSSNEDKVTGSLV